MTRVLRVRTQMEVSTAIVTVDLLVMDGTVQVSMVSVIIINYACK